MTKILVCLSAFLLMACGDYPNYERGGQVMVPDSLRDKEALFVVKTVKAASFKMTGGDYEDPEDVIEQAYSTFEDIYGRFTIGLIYKQCSNCRPEFIPQSQFTEEQKILYIKLTN